MQNESIRPLAGACDNDCPVARAAAVLSPKWTTLIFRDLLGGTRRYSELQASLVGISPKILAERLRLLEGEGLVRRDLFPTVPPRTEYSLTALGRKAEPVIMAMATFGNQLSHGPSSGENGGRGKD